MSHMTHADIEPDPAIDPYADPVSYLASFGVEAELIVVISTLPQAA